MIDANTADFLDTSHRAGPLCTRADGVNHCCVNLQDLPCGVAEGVRGGLQGTFNILRTLDDALRPEDMNLPGFRFHGLAGRNKGRFAVDACGNWRITFGSADGDTVEEKQPVTPAMALRLGSLCGNGPDLWLNLPKRYDLQCAEREPGEKIKAIRDNHDVRRPRNVP